MFTIPILRKKNLLVVRVINNELNFVFYYFLFVKWQKKKLLKGFQNKISGVPLILKSLNSLTWK